MELPRGSKSKPQALEMTVKKINGSEYLFVEVGGFNSRNPVGWKSPYYVMKRK
jgi:hypothetical protein